MPKYSVPLTTWANITVTVETDETDPLKIAELALEEASVSLCHSCGGDRNHGLEVGDAWEPTLTDGKPEVYESED